MLNVIVPMAGYGRRFREAGYQEEKPLIKVGGKTLLEWSCEGLPNTWNILAIIRADQQSYALEETLADLRPPRHRDAPNLGSWETVIIPGPTQGAALSVLAAAVGLPPDEPVLVMNCDQWFRIGKARVVGKGLCGAAEVVGLQGVCDFAVQHSWDGFVLTFPGTGPAWSYAVTNGTDRVVWVVEKKQVSEYATVGVYWWHRARDLVRSVCAMVASGQRTNDEFYLAPSFCHLPLADYDVRIVPVDEFHGLGTPEQVKEFEALVAGGWCP